MPASDLSETLIRLALTRGPEKTFCPSEVAIKLDPENWRNHLSEVRIIANQLIAEGFLECTQKGKKIDPTIVKGPIRLGLAKKSKPSRK